MWVEIALYLLKKSYPRYGRTKMSQDDVEAKKYLKSMCSFKCIQGKRHKNKLHIFKNFGSVCSRPCESVNIQKIYP